MAQGNGKTRTKSATVASPVNGAEIIPGNPGNSGGKPGRSGRKPTLLVQKAQEIFEDRRLLEVAADIAVGDIWEEWVQKDGTVVSGPTKNSDRLAAIRYITEYGWGKAPQTVNLTGTAPIQITNVVVHAEGVE